MSDLSQRANHQSIIKMFDEMRQYEMFGKLNPDGVIVYADDQFINRQFLQISLEESQVANRCHIFQDG